MTQFILQKWYWHRSYFVNRLFSLVQHCLQWIVIFIYNSNLWYHLTKLRSSMKGRLLCKSLQGFPWSSSKVEIVTAKYTCCITLIWGIKSFHFISRLSASGIFFVNISYLELYNLSFSHFGTTLWNEIPSHFRHCPKNKPKKHSANYFLIFWI